MAPILGGNAGDELGSDFQLSADGSTLLVGDVEYDADGAGVDDNRGQVQVYHTPYILDLVNNASRALNRVSAAIEDISTERAKLGALHNRFEFTVSNLMNIVEFTSAARSRIEDADFAVETARLAKAQVLQQSGTAMLSQANAAPSLVLSLLEVA